MLPFAGVCGLLLTACYAPSTLYTHGPAADRIATLWWVLLSIATTVFLIVCAFLAWGLFRRREPDAQPRRVNGGAWVAWCGVIIPSVILAVAFGFTLSNMLALASPPSQPAFTVQVIGHQWWWEVRYPGQHITTANEIHIPVGQSVAVELSSADVIHSFWDPQLQKKTDVFPGRTTSTWLVADQPGDYRGQCAEYCGVQHGHMAFHVIADPPAVFAAWVRQESQPAPQPAADTPAARGLQTFSRVGCIACHTVQFGSTGAPVMTVGGKKGPDLTHLASRGTIASGTLPNTRGNLGGWILNSQAIKPGNEMPPQPVDSKDLQDLLDFLEGLK